MDNMFSPGRLTRSQEKAELGSLNDRLAVYMNHVRELKEANTILEQRVELLSSAESSLSDKQKDLMAKDLALCRELLEKTSNEKLGFQRDFVAANELNEELEKKLHDLKAKNAKLEDDNKGLHRKYDMQSLQIKELRETTDEANKARAEAERALAELEDQLRDVKKQLGQQSQLRAEHENKIATLEDELALLKKNYTILEVSKSQELKKLMITRESVQKEVKSHFNEQLAAALAATRERYELEAQAYQQEMDAFYKNALEANGIFTELPKSGEGDEAAASLSAARTWQTKYEGMATELSASQATIASLNKRILKLEEEMEQAELRRKTELAKKDQTINTLREQIAAKDKEFKDLMNVRIALDSEIMAYRRLLEMAETKAGIPSPLSSSTFTSTRGGASSAANDADVSVYAPAPNAAKRKADDDDDLAKRTRPSNFDKSVEFEESDPEITNIVAKTETNGPITISELNIDGYFVQLENTSDEEVSLSKWTLVSTFDGERHVFTFPRLKLPAKGLVNIWSASSGTKHKPPTDLLWKELEAISSAAGSSIQLFDKEDQVMASTVIETPQSEIFHPVEPKAENENCSIM